MLYTGIVARGEGKGKALGYPTANIPLSDEALSGIYAATVRVGETDYRAAVFADPRRTLLEAYLLDFDGDLYGEEITIRLHEKIRESKRFADEDELRRAIEVDIKAVRDYFA